MRDVAVVGIGINKWGELWDKSYRTIFAEAALAAMDDAAAGGAAGDPQAIYVGTMSGGLFAGQEHIGSILSDYLGVNPIPAVRVESACASGGLAFRQAYIDVASGLHDVVLAAGVEKMTDVGGDEATYALATAADQEYEVYNGVTFPALYAMIARKHMHQFGTSREQLAHVAVKNHRHGALNPDGQFPQEVTLETVMKSSMVADPLRLLDCSPITDGAAAAILMPLELARKKSKKPLVKIAGSGHATDTIALHQRKDMTLFASTVKAAEMAYKMAGTGPGDVDFAEVHDCFTIAEICVLEALGFVERGKGGQAAESGMTALGGKIPVNTSGGLKSKGHPVGATGVAQIVEAVKQLRGDAGKRQVKNARRGLTQNMGGTGGSTLVHILEKV